MPVFWWFRAAGCLLLFLGASGTGVSMAVRYTDRLRELVRLRQMLIFLKGKMVHAGMPLPQALGEVGERSGGSLGQMFLSVSGRLADTPGLPFAAVWEEEIGALKGTSWLCGEDRQELSRLAEYLGYLDRGTQERSLLLYLEELDGKIGTLQAGKRDACRLYSSLGVLGGLFLAVLLC